MNSIYSNFKINKTKILTSNTQILSFNQEEMARTIEQKNDKIANLLD